MSQTATLKGLKCPYCGSENLIVTGVKGALGASMVTSLVLGAVGNLVAGKDAAKNTATEPLQYKCDSCKNKFESLPLAAPPEEILNAPCTVTFTREKSMVGAAVPQILYLNGVKLGAVKNGATVSFSTQNRYNVLFVTDQHGVAFNSVYRFEAQPKGRVDVRFKRVFKDAPATASGFATATEAPHAQASEPASVPEIPAVRFCTNCGKPIDSVSASCAICGARRFVPEAEDQETQTSAPTADLAATPWSAAQPAPKRPVVAIEPTPKRALLSFAVLAVLWLLMRPLAGTFSARLLYNTVTAMLGVGVYMLLQKESKFKLFAIVGGVITSLLFALCDIGAPLSAIIAPVLFKLFGRELLSTAATMGAAFWAWQLLKSKSDKTRLRITALTGAVVNGVTGLMMPLIYGIPLALNALLSFFAYIVIFYLSVIFIDALCRENRANVNLYGVGKVWAWIAAISMGFAFVAAIINLVNMHNTMSYGDDLLLAACGAAGYILLLARKRIGYYILLAVPPLILIGQLTQGLIVMELIQYNGLVQLFGSILGGVNLLLGWLSVRAADNRDITPLPAPAAVSAFAAAPAPVAKSAFSAVPAPAVAQKHSVFQKVVAICNIVAGALLLVAIVENLTSDYPEAGFIITFIALMALYLTLGIMSLAVSRDEPIPKWLKVVNVVLFPFGVFLIAGVTFAMLSMYL